MGSLGKLVLPVDILERLERFHRECVDYHSRQFVPKWDSHNGGLGVDSMGNKGDSWVCKGEETKLYETGY